mmetsp:Transcript_25479/g.39941  ORF Transcript_25479/g.39941 Transcript_25479/m.39941 type:complete len:619 (-) Transcript_25479:556-2412(-)
MASAYASQPQTFAPGVPNSRLQVGDEEGAITAFTRWMEELDAQELASCLDSEQDRFVMRIDMLKLADKDVELAQLLVTDPAWFAEIGVRVVRKLLGLMGLNCQLSTRIWFRPFNFPILGFHRVAGGTRNLHRLTGRVVSTSSSFPYTWSRLVRCSAPQCYMGKEPFVIYSPPGSIGGATCKHCGCLTLTEHCASRSTYQAQELVISVDKWSSRESGDEIARVPRPVHILLQDELVEDLNRWVSPGQEIEVLGYFGVIEGLKGSGATCLFLVSNLLQPGNRVPFYHSVAVTFEGAMEELATVTSSVLSTLPFFNFKLMLLLSLVSSTPSETKTTGGRKGLERSNLHMLCLGSDQGLLPHFLNDALGDSSLKVNFLKGEGDIVPKYSVSSESGTWRIDTSKLLNSQGGVISIDLGLVKKNAELQALKSVLDSQQVRVGKDSSVWSVPAEVSVIALLSTPNVHTQAMTDSFDLICDLQDVSDEDLDKEVCRIFFDGVSHEEHEASLSKRELGFIIDNARKLNPEFTERAQSLIFAFLKCTRRVLSHGPVSFPYQADSLVRIAKAVASLRLSALVDLADVTIAIAVYEESRAAKLLPTLLQFENFPNGRSNLELYSDNLPGS